MHVLVVCVIEPQVFHRYGRALHGNANLRIVLQRAALTARRHKLVDVDSQAAALHAPGACGPEKILAETPPASTQEFLIRACRYAGKDSILQGRDLVRQIGTRVEWSPESDQIDHRELHAQGRLPNYTQTDRRRIVRTLS